MEDNHTQFALSGTKNPVSAFEMIVDDSDVDSTAVVATDNAPEVNDSFPTKESVWTLVQKVQRLAREITVMGENMDDMKAAISALHTEVDHLKESIKMVEFLVCTRDCVKNTNDEILRKLIPPKSDSSNAANDNLCTPPSTAHESGQKRKFMVAKLEEDTNVSMMDPKEDEKANVIMSLSDEEDDVDAKKLCQANTSNSFDRSISAAKAGFTSGWPYPMESERKKEGATAPFMFGSGQRRIGAMQIDLPDGPNIGITQITKRLFNTPSPTHTSSITRGINERLQISSCVIGASILDNPPQSDGKGKGKASDARSSTQRTPKYHVPRGTNLRFRITSDMNVQNADLPIYIYVFHQDQDLGEVLVQTKEMVVTRADFLCLSPGRRVDTKILTLVAEKTTWVHKNLNYQSVWSLPPSFADEVFHGHNIFQLLKTYRQDWMPAFPDLKYIYIPIHNSEDHWYLGVISLVDKVLFQFDSWLEVKDIEHREHQIKLLAKVVSEMVSSSPHFENVFEGRDLDFGKWDVKEARGIPNCGSSLSSSVWMLEWLSMEASFTPYIIGKLKENHVRMKIVIDLLIGLHNAVAPFVEQNAWDFWKTLPR